MGVAAAIFLSLWSAHLFLCTEDYPAGEGISQKGLTTFFTGCFGAGDMGIRNSFHIEAIGIYIDCRLPVPFAQVDQTVLR